MNRKNKQNLSRRQLTLPNPGIYIFSSLGFCHSLRPRGTPFIPQMTPLITTSNSSATYNKQQTQFQKVGSMFTVVLRNLLESKEVLFASCVVPKPLYIRSIKGAVTYVQNTFAVDTNTPLNRHSWWLLKFSLKNTTSMILATWNVNPSHPETFLHSASV